MTSFVLIRINVRQFVGLLRTTSYDSRLNRISSNRQSKPFSLSIRLQPKFEILGCPPPSNRHTRWTVYRLPGRLPGCPSGCLPVCLPAWFICLSLRLACVHGWCMFASLIVCLYVLVPLALCPFQFIFGCARLIALHFFPFHFPTTEHSLVLVRRT